jgi:hypothetical protein
LYFLFQKEGFLINQKLIKECHNYLKDHHPIDPKAIMIKNS